MVIESKSLIMSLLDNFFIPISVYDAAGCLIYSNRAFDRLFGSPPPVMNLIFNCTTNQDSAPILSQMPVSPGQEHLDAPIPVKYFKVSQENFVGFIVFCYDMNSIRPVDESSKNPYWQRVGGKLSKRQARILDLIYSGLTVKEISENLSISVNTVKTHIKNIYRKFGVQSRLQLMHQLFSTTPEDNRHKVGFEE